MREDMDFFAHTPSFPSARAAWNSFASIALESRRSGDDHLVTFPEPAYSVRLDANPEFDTPSVRYQYQSLVTPASVYDYDMDTQAATLLKQTPVLGGYDPAQYVSERLHAPRVRRDADPDLAGLPQGRRRATAPRPLLLYGYGSYGISYPGELLLEPRQPAGPGRGLRHRPHPGRRRDGRRLARRRARCSQKRNTFTDFIACAEHLIAEKYTSPDRLAIQGGSAGGLLMGAVDQPAPGPLPRRAVPGAVRGRPEHDARRHPAADRRRVSGMGQPERRKPTTST